MLECALAFAYTGDSRVLTRTLMRPFGLSRSLIELGLPAITAIDFNTHLSQYFAHNPALWPLTSSREPAVASKKALSLTYGDDHFYVSKIRSFLCYAHMGDERYAHIVHRRYAHVCMAMKDTRKWAMDYMRVSAMNDMRVSAMNDMPNIVSAKATAAISTSVIRFCSDCFPALFCRFPDLSCNVCNPHPPLSKRR